ncbi:MAG: Flagellar FliJ protein [Planctomycetota bacterium]
MADSGGMRRFRFRLQPLVRLRAQFEKQARRELATAMTAVNQLEQQAAAAAQGVRDCADQAADSGAVGMLARSLEVGLRRHRWRVEKQLEGANKSLERAQGEYAKRMKDLKMVAQLRDKRRAEWRDQVVRAEQAELDELAALRRGDAASGDAS